MVRQPVNTGAEHHDRWAYSGEAVCVMADLRAHHGVVDPETLRLRFEQGDEVVVERQLIEIRHYLVLDRDSKLGADAPACGIEVVDHRLHPFARGMPHVDADLCRICDDTGTVRRGGYCSNG